MIFNVLLISYNFVLFILTNMSDTIRNIHFYFHIISTTNNTNTGSNKNKVLNPLGQTEKDSHQCVCLTLRCLTKHLCGLFHIRSNKKNTLTFYRFLEQKLISENL